MNFSVAVLGAGPSGLAAAHAAALSGASVAIYTRAELAQGGTLDNPRAAYLPIQSKLFGAQYLHEPIPDIDCGAPVDLAVQFIGTADGYRDKVYGEDYRGRVSPTQFHSDHKAWDIRLVYNTLWNYYYDSMVGADFDRNNIEEAIRDLREVHDMIISTIPRGALCCNPQHEFKSQSVFAIGDAPELGVKNPIHCEPNTLVYNGSPDYGWYRKSNIFGHSTTEWPSREGVSRPPIRGLAAVEKPLSTNCDCWPSVRFMGRYGAWKKGILVHHVYRAAEGAMKNVLQGEQGALF